MYDLVFSRKNKNSGFGILCQDDLGFYLQLCELNVNEYPFAPVKDEIRRVRKNEVIGISYEKSHLTCYVFE